jgi:transposase
VIGNLKNANRHNFFIRISIRKGSTAAITANARKLAIIIWYMVVKRQTYTPPNAYEFLDQKQKRIVRELQNKIAKFDVKTDEINFSNS